jgi:hypothetical protein
MECYSGLFHVPVERHSFYRYQGYQLVFRRMASGSQRFFHCVDRGIQCIHVGLEQDSGRCYRRSQLFGETFSFIATAFGAAWIWVSELFTSIWEGIKGVVMGFVEWLSPVIDRIIAPFKVIGNDIGDIIGSVKGWFGETVEIGETEIARMNENNLRDAAAKPVQTATPAHWQCKPLRPRLAHQVWYPRRL